MSYLNQWRTLHQWTRNAIEAGWLPAASLASVTALEQPAADSLFNQQKHRPLLVAFFGGTGAGKSSLLNRLAGGAIAKSGIQRPTSHEVTLYLHKDFQLDLLPADLPLAATRIRYHQESGRRLLAWVDMPDMDSTAAENRQLVEAWLPYIDWLIYVVTPERYHDDRGWRFLQQRRQRHAWLFVMNHWDQGQPAQLEDFHRRLTEEGFTHPQILRTACLPGFEGDDFAQLEQHIQQAVEQHGISLLQQLGQQARWDDLHHLAQRLIEQMGTSAQWKEAQQRWQQQLTAALDTFFSDLSQKARTQQQLINAKDASVSELPNQFPTLLDTLIPPGCRDQMAGLNLRLRQATGEHLPNGPLATALQSLEEEAPTQLRQHFQQQLEAALTRPGHPWQRGLRRINQELGWLLPLSASGWVIWHVVSGYIRGTTEGAPFLGIDFAIHSTLLIGLAWLMPFWLGRKLKPRAGNIFHQGFRQGLSEARSTLENQYNAIWQKLLLDRDHQIKILYNQLDNIKSSLAKLDIVTLSGSLIATAKKSESACQNQDSPAE